MSSHFNQLIMDRFFRPHTLLELSTYNRLPTNPVDTLLSSQDASEYAPESSQDATAAQSSAAEDNDGDDEGTNTSREMPTLLLST